MNLRLIKFTYSMYTGVDTVEKNDYVICSHDKNINNCFAENLIINGSEKLISFEEIEIYYCSNDLKKEALLELISTM